MSMNCSNNASIEHYVITELQCGHWNRRKIFLLVDHMIKRSAAYTVMEYVVYNFTLSPGYNMEYQTLQVKTATVWTCWSSVYSRSR